MVEISICEEGNQILSKCYSFWKNYINILRLTFEQEHVIDSNRSLSKWISFLKNDLEKYSAIMENERIVFEKEELATLFLLKYS